MDKKKIVDTIGSVDDLIEINESFLRKFQKLLNKTYSNFCMDISSKVPLSSLILRTGKLAKNDEWFGQDVLDLSSMPIDNVFINNFSKGEDFKTNIKIINNHDLVYGSIRPYFKKSGIAVDVNYAAGTVFSFKPKDENDYIWLLALISSNDFHQFTAKNSQGTKMPIINWNVFGTYDVPYDRYKVNYFNNRFSSPLTLAMSKMRIIRKLRELKTELITKYFPTN